MEGSTMKKGIIKTLLATAIIAAAVVFVPAKSAQAATNEYIYVNQASEFLNKSQQELEQARNQRQQAEEMYYYVMRVGKKKQQEQAYYAFLEADKNFRQKEDKVYKAQNILYFCQTHSNEEAFLAGMQEKFKNEAALEGMKNQIAGANDAVNGALWQAENIKATIQTQTALNAQSPNPIYEAQIAELNVQYNAWMAEYQQRLAVKQQLEAQYNAYVATLNLPTADDYIKLAQIKQVFQYTCELYDAAVKE